MKEIVLKAMGQAISKTVAIAEIIKVGVLFDYPCIVFSHFTWLVICTIKQKRIPRLHQDTAISSVSITDVWEPIEEGLVP